jgi:hypothetical protein
MLRRSDRRRLREDDACCGRHAAINSEPSDGEVVLGRSDDERPAEAREGPCGSGFGAKSNADAAWINTQARYQRVLDVMVRWPMDIVMRIHVLEILRKQVP